VLIDKSAAIFYHQIAAWVPDMFFDFYLAKNRKIANTKQPLKLEKNKPKFGILKNLDILCRFWLNLKSHSNIT
jgi:hypothetical protein